MVVNVGPARRRLDALCIDLVQAVLMPRHFLAGCLDFVEWKRGVTSSASRRRMCRVFVWP